MDRLVNEKPKNAHKKTFRVIENPQDGTHKPMQLWRVFG
jgi:hypothetical protein